MNDRLLIRAKVEIRCRITCFTIYRLMRAGQFPLPVKVGTRVVRWLEHELEKWRAKRPRATGEPR